LKDKEAVSDWLRGKRNLNPNDVWLDHSGQTFRSNYTHGTFNMKCRERPPVR